MVVQGICIRGFGRPITVVSGISSAPDGGQGDELDGRPKMYLISLPVQQKGIPRLRPLGPLRLPGQLTTLIEPEPLSKISLIIILRGV